MCEFQALNHIGFVIQKCFLEFVAINSEVIRKELVASNNIDFQGDPRTKTNAGKELGYHLVLGQSFLSANIRCQTNRKMFQSFYQIPKRVQQQ